MGGALTRATRVFRMYNIDNRVEKVLSKDKPVPAPRYPTEPSTNTDGNVASEVIHEKDKQLLDYLQDVKVYSTGTNPEIRRSDDKTNRRNMPPLLNRLEEPLDENSADGAFGYVESQRIPPGRVSLRQFLAYLQQHRDSPEEYSVQRFADMYTIKVEQAQQIFKYHSLLSLQEISRPQSKAPDRPPHLAAAEVFGIEAEAVRKTHSPQKF